MEEKRFCECGCGLEVTTWKNGIQSPFRRGHHMRKQGYRPPPKSPHYCECGCGKEIPPLQSNGYVRRFFKGHHLKGKKLSMEYRIERTRSRWGHEPILSPYVPDCFLHFNKVIKRWTTWLRSDTGGQKGAMHAYAVYQHYFGEIPEGYVVHHKDGKHSKITDDRPDNLMLLLDGWNLRLFPSLAKGFNIPESKVTDAYLAIFDTSLAPDILFEKLCLEIIRRKKNDTSFIREQLPR